METCTVMYKAKHDLLPTRLNQLFAVNMNSTRQKGNFQVSYKRTTLKSFCVTSRGVCLWNNLNHNLKICHSEKMFKIKYKKFLIANYKVSFN